MKCPENYISCEDYNLKLDPEFHCMRDSNIGECIRKGQINNIMIDLYNEVNNGRKKIENVFGNPDNFFQLLNDYSSNAKQFMEEKQREGLSFKDSYRLLFRENCWKKARKMIYIFWNFKDQANCIYCGKKILSGFQIHHIKYNINRIFDPYDCRLIHRICHKKIHLLKLNNKN